MDKERTWEEELAESLAQPDPWSDLQGEWPRMAAQNPPEPSTSRLRRLISSLRGNAARLRRVARRELAGLRCLVGDQIEALRTSFDRACVTLPDGRRLLATEHAALMAFARANEFAEEMLWTQILPVPTRVFLGWRQASFF